MKRFFNIEMPFLRFAGNTLVMSCLSIAPLLLVYILLAPGFMTLLLTSGPALSRFLRQIVTNGIPVVFVVNYLSFFLYALVASRPRETHLPMLVLLIDLPGRVIIFVLLHGLIYVMSADWFGSFGGDQWLALRVVGPTLVRSVFFENISGVYLYATLVSALPLYMAMVGRMLNAETDRATRLRRWTGIGPGRAGQIVVQVVIAFILFAAFALLMTGFAALIVAFQQP